MRTTIELSGSGGDVQITSIFFASSGCWRWKNRMPTVLLVATSSTPLATENELAWWLAARTALKHFAGSMPFGVYRLSEQVGFARVVTDKATFAYLADVFIVEAHRGRGLSKRLMAFVMAHPDLQGLRRFMLATKDAHGLYAQFGFTATANPARIMEILRTDAYQHLARRT